MRKYFNFHNEENLTEIDVSEEGVVTLTLGDQTEQFDSIDKFAEFYAVARNVKPENLKNWKLIEDGDTYSYILKAGTAGLDEDPEEVDPESDIEDIDFDDASILEDGLDLEESMEDDENLDDSSETSIPELLRRVILENFFDGQRYILQHIVDFNDIDQYIDSYNYREEYYYEDYEYVSKYDVIRYNLTNLLNDTLNSYKDEYSKIASVVVFDILNGLVTDNHIKENDGFSSGEEAQAILSKGALASKLAGRDVPIVKVTIGEANTIDGFEQKWLNEDAVDTQDGILYAVHKKFYLVK